MAEVRTTAHVDIDKLLDLLSEAWAEMPRIAAEIEGWDPSERVDFLEEWALEEDRLVDLERYAAEGALSDDQRARYDALCQQIAQHRPTLDALLCR